MTECQVISRVRRKIRRAGGLRALAREWDVSPSYLSELVNGLRSPGPVVLGPLGLRRVVRVTYEPAEAGG